MGTKLDSQLQIYLIPHFVDAHACIHTFRKILPEYPPSLHTILTPLMDHALGKYLNYGTWVRVMWLL